MRNFTNEKSLNPNAKQTALQMTKIISMNTHVLCRSTHETRLDNDPVMSTKQKVGHATVPQNEGVQ